MTAHSAAASPRCRAQTCVFTFPHTERVCEAYRATTRPPRLAGGGIVTNPRFRDGANVMPR